MALNSLFIDINAYFASVEQQMRPELRDRPVAVVPLLTDTTCCIAASYEAKAFGIKTGTAVGEAKRLCPQLTLVEARPELYVRAHHAIRAAVETCLPVEAVHSIDEVSCRLSGAERQPAAAVEKARAIKEALRRHLGDYIRCSIGVAPNTFLAKVAGDMQKPDGLTIIRLEDLPHKLYSLDLIDLPGIGPRMRQRLHHQGVKTVEQLCATSRPGLRKLWNGVVGERWWYVLRGQNLPLQPTRRRSVGHSHVLAPDLRNEEDAYAVLVHLLSKAAFRLRRLGYCARRLNAHVSCLRQDGWRGWIDVPPTQDTILLIHALETLWKRRKIQGRLLKVGVALDHLVLQSDATLPLFAEERRQALASKVIDRINSLLGRNALYAASVHAVRGAAPTRIAFTAIPDLAEPDWAPLDEYKESLLMPRTPKWEYLPDPD